MGSTSSPAAELLAAVPSPPSFVVGWEEIDRRHAWVRALAGCEQDPQHHAEGDVWIHTRLVCEALASLPAWRALPEGERQVVFLAALLHDIAKPATTRKDDAGRVTAKGHSRRGEIQIRSLLWELGVPSPVREQIAALVRYHQIPFFLIERDDHRRLAFAVSQAARCDHLALVAWADAAGRRCADQQRLFDNIALFVEECRAEGCLTAPRRFPSDHSRFLYFRRDGRDPDYLAHDDTRCEVILLAGLPGSGKDHWARTHAPELPSLSLDDARRELEIDPDQPQGAVIARGEAVVREQLRRGQSFVWNATNLGRSLRGQWINLFEAYQARVRIVYLEVPPSVLREQNRQRPAAQVVPEKVIERMRARWELPDLTEAHAVQWLIQEA